MLFTTKMIKMIQGVIYWLENWSIPLRLSVESLAPRVKSSVTWNQWQSHTYNKLYYHIIGIIIDYMKIVGWGETILSLTKDATHLKVAFNHITILITSWRSVMAKWTVKWANAIHWWIPWVVNESSHKDSFSLIFSKVNKNKVQHKTVEQATQKIKTHEVDVATMLANFYQYTHSATTDWH